MFSLFESVQGVLKGVLSFCSHSQLHKLAENNSDNGSQATIQKSRLENTSFEAKGTGVVSKADFSKIRYSQVWEDTRILRKALQIRPDSVVLSIASAGDNVLGLLLDNPKKIVAIDFSLPQLALCALKIEAIRYLNYDEFVHLLGFTFGAPISVSRVELYQRVRSFLPDQYQAYWDIHQNFIEKGIIHTGRLEKYFNIYNTYLLRLSHSSKDIHRHLSITNPQKKKVEYKRNFKHSWVYQKCLRFYFGEEILALFGRDKAFFTHVKMNVADHNTHQFERGLSGEIPAHDNFYLEYILTGNISGRYGVPDYLERQNYLHLRSKLDKIELVHDDLLAYLQRCASENDPSSKGIGNRGTESDKQVPMKFDAFNLSDIFEWMDDEMYTQTMRDIHSASNKGATLAYWNLYVLRERPEKLSNLFDSHKDTSRKLFMEQRTTMYRNFVVERVI